jgi:hypothetical protein
MLRAYACLKGFQRKRDWTRTCEQTLSEITKFVFQGDNEIDQDVCGDYRIGNPPCL